MDVLRLSDAGVERRSPDDLDLLLKDDGVVWVDVPAWDDEAAAVLTERFGIHERAAADCARRNPVPKVHVYPGHVFFVLHAPERGARGHVHYVELDQFVGPDWLITVHGPVNPPSAAKSLWRRAGPWRAGSRAAGCIRRPLPICRSRWSRH
jgi:magnesium transporter